MTGEKIVELHEALGGAEFETWRSLWVECAQYADPRKADDIYEKSLMPDTSAFSQLYDSTGIDANMDLARGIASQITPKDAAWFAFVPSEELEKDEEAKNWLSKAALTVRRHLANSNFYKENMEGLLDRGCFGTDCLHVEWNPERQGLWFQTFQIGSYHAKENWDREVDTVTREYDWTAEQAAKRLGAENLPEDVQKKLSDPKRAQDKDCYIHAILPRNPEDVSELAGPIASIYVHKKSKRVALDTSFADMPVFVSRFLRWAGLTGGAQPWGLSPTMLALPDLRQLNYLEKSLDAQVDLAVHPPLLVPDDQFTRFDIRPGGMNSFDPNSPAMPQPFYLQNNLQAAEIRAQQKRERARKHYMVDIMNMFTGGPAEMASQRNMTATQVVAMEQEKLNQFASMNDLLTSEKLERVVLASFNLLLLNGAFPLDSIPQSLLSPNEAGEAVLQRPKVEFTSRLALAVSADSNKGLMQTLELAAQLGQVQPEVWDNWDLDAVIRQMHRSSGADPDLLKPRQVMESERSIRAQQLAAMQAQEAANG